VSLDAAVIFAPAGELVPVALSRLERGATVAVNAIHMSTIPAFAYDDLYWERGVRSVANYTRRDAQEFLALAAELGVHAQVERYRMEDAKKHGEVHGAAVLDISAG
jgi:propanol-preferring alcohol dehydrogenase